MRDDLPPCIDENFDRIVIDLEWTFCNELGRHLEGGDVKVVEQFSSLTSLSLARLTQYFERELQKRPDEVVGIEIDKRYKSILNSVRSTSPSKNGLYLIASPHLDAESRDLKAVLRTCYYLEEDCETYTNRYDGPMFKKSDCTFPPINLGTGIIRLQHLHLANTAFAISIGINLNVVVLQRANLKRVNHKLQKIKRTTYKLSDTIMDCVKTELIQTCFAFATEFRQRSILYIDPARLTALKFAMVITRGHNILSVSDSEYFKLRATVASCMSLLISHFDIMGARSNQRLKSMASKLRLNFSRVKDDAESLQLVQQQWCKQLC
ncbi:hypothetical protein D6D05_10409 [Aureobasidium pullulans]|nr:hypothetical protein D6D05_10409 [Aureobasidium pullulans]